MSRFSLIPLLVGIPCHINTLSGKTRDKFRNSPKNLFQKSTLVHLEHRNTILKKDGYVNVDADGAITLTETGLAIAKTMYTRHTVLSQMLMELGVDEETATEDACRIEHVISEKSFAAVQAHLEQVTKMREDAHGQ